MLHFCSRLEFFFFFFKWVKMLFFDERERFRQDEERYRCFSDICSGLSLMRHYSFTLRRAELTNAQKGEVRFSIERQGPPEGQRRFAVLCSLWHRPAPRARSSPFTCMRCPAGQSTEKKVLSRKSSEAGNPSSDFQRRPQLGG